MIKIALINAREVSSYLGMLHESSALSTIVYNLAEVGVDNIAVFPSTPEEADLFNYNEKVDSFIDEHKPSIVAISCWTSGYQLAVSMAKTVREANPESIIIAGGPHFAADEEIIHSLNLGEFDIIFKGACTPFIKLCDALLRKRATISKSDKGVTIQGYIPDTGIAYRDSHTGEIIVNRIAVLEGAVAPIAEVYEDKVEINIIVNDACPNNCDYCVITPSVISRKSVDTLLEHCKYMADIAVSEVNKPIRYALADSAPFITRKRTLPIMKRLQSMHEGVTFSLFADPQDIIFDASGGSLSMTDIIKEYDVNSLFFGRDRVVEDNKLGRKYKGELRTQALLDKELEQIIKLIDFASNELKSSFEIYIGYIVSPFDDKVTARKLIDEIKLLSTYPAREHVTVQTNMFVLDPYPGTVVAQRHKGLYIPMRMFYHPYPNTWHNLKLPHSDQYCSNDTEFCQILMEMTRFILSKLLCNPMAKSMYSAFLEFSYELQYSGVANVEFAEMVEDSALKRLTQFIMGRIAEMKFAYNPTSDDYIKNITELHLMGSMMVAVLNKPEWLQSGQFGQILDAVRRNDPHLKLLQQDLEMIKGLFSNPPI